MTRFRVDFLDDRITITFDDGGMNLLSRAALEELDGVVRTLTSSVPAGSRQLVVLRSGRESLFAAGADMAEMSRFDAIDAWEFALLGQRVFDAIERLPMLTIAMIDGDCFGGALDLALAFDLRFATPRSRFAHPGARIGIVTGFGGTTRWRKTVSRPVANQLFLANRVFQAGEAEQAGLVDVVAGSFDLAMQRVDLSRAFTIKKSLFRPSSHRRSQDIFTLTHGIAGDASRSRLGRVPSQRRTDPKTRR
jgi:enoyl-CoA hydratase